MSGPLTPEELRALYTSDTGDPGDDTWYAERGINYDRLNGYANLAAQWILDKKSGEHPAVLLEFMFVAGARFGLLIGAEMCKRQHESDTIH